jgi:Arc/MetJ-type ribon-helix-helix transcriptional regulator
MQRPIELGESQLHELERLASEEQRSVDELVQIAVGDFLARKQHRPDWAKRLEEAIETLRADLPNDIPSDEIERDVTAAWNEQRATRAKPLHSDPEPDAGRH